MSVLGNTELTLTEERGMLLDVAREFCRNRSPLAAVRAQLEQPSGYDAGVWEEMVSLGWTGIALPEQVGGSALNPGALVPVLESMGRSMLGTPLLSTVLACQLLLRAAPDAHDTVLAEAVEGAAITVALLESEDWASSALGCSVDADGRLCGRKLLVHDAASARYFIVVLAVDGQPALALVSADTLPADALSPHTLVDETRRAASMDFTGARPLALISGSRVESALRDHFLLGALYVAAEAAGSAAACLDTVVDYLKTRRQFGKLIGSYQALKHPAVDVLTRVDATRSFVYHAASLLDAGPLSEDAEIACRMAKAQATETLCYAGDRAVQFHGGMGFTYDCDAQLFLRRGLWAQQQFGDAQHHRQRLAPLLLDAG